MIRPIDFLDRWLDGLAPGAILALSVAATTFVGYLDFITGYEFSMGLFYVPGVMLSAWYVSQRAGIGIAVLSAIAWFAADTGHDYSHPAFQAWNATIRLGFFLICGILASAVRVSLVRERTLARIDRLTGLLTGRAFEEQFERDLAIARQQRKPMSLAGIALDDLGSIRGRHGRAEADRIVLAAAAAVIRKARTTDTIARLSDDEFAVVMLDCGEEAARGVIGGITAELQSVLRGAGPRSTCSIAVTVFPDGRIPAAAALAAAARHLKDVKTQARGSVRYAVKKDPVMSAPPGAGSRAGQ